MEHITTTASIAQEIQLSVAPVFLLTAIAGVLSVLSSRLNRVIDRIREVSVQKSADVLTVPGDENLKRRIWLIQWSIRLFVIAALFICLVVSALFVGDYVKPDLAPLIALLFILTMLMMTIGLLLFLYEIGLATKRINLTLESVTETID